MATPKAGKSHATHTVRWLKWLGLIVMAACADAPVDGQDGADGATGERGPVGRSGSMGPQGADGMRGATGMSPTSGQLDKLVDDILDERQPGALTTDRSCDALALDEDDFDVVLQLGAPLQSGEEAELCAVHQLGPSPLYMQWSELLTTRGAHHGVVFLADYDELPEETITGEPIEKDVAMPCEAGARSVLNVRRLVAGSQGRGNHSEKGRLPPDVAIELPANAVLVTNFHMLNTSDESIDACMKVGLAGIPEKEVKHKAGTFAFYNNFIAIPPAGEATARMACPINKDIEVITAVSHMHARGDHYVAELWSGSPFSPDATVLNELYETQDWESPSDAVFDPPLSVRAGSWIDFRCEYANLEPRPISSGYDVGDEMCMFIGLYYPQDDALSFCNDQGDPPTIIGRASYIIGDGELDGAGFLDCFWNSPLDFSQCGSAECTSPAARFATQACFTMTCPAIGPYTRPYLTCIAENRGVCEAGCKAAAPQLETLCAATSDAAAGCSDSYGTNGMDGSCATSDETRDQAVATCSSQVRRRVIDQVCDGTCAACKGDDVAGCDACKGVVDFDQNNTGCLNAHTLRCVQSEISTLAIDCAKSCFETCIAKKTRECAVQCLNVDHCAEHVDQLMETICE